MQIENRYNQRLLAMREAKDILVASHTGYCGWNIISNTVESFDIAVRLGADIVEMDIAMSSDGELFVFHPGKEPIIFRSLNAFQKLPAAYIRRSQYYNPNGGPSGRYPDTFDEVLESLKGRCLLNLDKTWDHPDEKRKWAAVFDAIERHDMADQIIFKSEAEQKYADMFGGMEKKYMYMPMLNKPEDLDMFLRPDINMVMAEVKFKTEKDYFAQPEAIEAFHKRGIMVWGNALNLSTNWCLAAGHDDHAALMGDPAKGWGYFVERGYDIIQTDHLSMMMDYFRSINVRV